MDPSAGTDSAPDSSPNSAPDFASVLAPSVDLIAVEGRLRGVQRICVALVVTALAFSTSSWVIALRTGGRPMSGLPEALPVFLPMTAAAFILVSSRLRSSILRRALPRSTLIQASLEGLLPAYRTATLASFALLACAALLGPLVALTTGSAGYGLIVCGAATFAMFTRWPRAVEVDRLLRGRAQP